MKYRAGERRPAAVYEKAIADWWKKNQTFEKSIKSRPVDKSYVFYDGPPFITGMPHHGTLLSSIVKDAVPRFWTMRGYRVERRWGWDCHGLPAENFVEKQLGITDRRDIGTKWSLEDYIIKARDSMVANSETWGATIDRIGRWVDFAHPYRTMDRDYMESVWWAFQSLYEAGKIYEGRKVLMYDTKFATPVSKAEVTMDNDAYQTVTDPSAYVKFKLQASDPTYLLAWTTTPWTLMANRALAVGKDIDYVKLKIDGIYYIVAKSRVEHIFGTDTAQQVMSEEPATIKGTALAGLKYESLDGHICSVFTADFVGAEEGTGIVHIAPAYGEDDYELYKKHSNPTGDMFGGDSASEMGKGPATDSADDVIDFVDVLDANGYYIKEYADRLHALGVRDTDEAGIQIWDANKFIAKVLEEKGIIYKIEYIQHEYPFNPRSKTRIMYRAFPSWFFDIDGQKEMMLAQNENINWFPAYLKHGRFAKNIEAAPDWNLSRDRFWATAMPVWKGEKTGAIKVFGSYAELEQFSGQRLDDYHRPWVDEIEFDAYVDEHGQVTSSKSVVTPAFASHPRLDHFTRIDKVLDCWFESGSMPFAELHYPFENKDKFEANYPADFIVEYVGQVRAWFYYVHAVNTALAEVGAFGEKAEQSPHKNAYKNVITTGTLAGNDGRKMSKSLGNFTDPNILMDTYSADALRFLLMSSPVCSGEDFALLDKDVSDTHRKLSMIWNVYDFFTTYAEVEGIDSDGLMMDKMLERHSEDCIGGYDRDTRSASPVTLAPWDANGRRPTGGGDSVSSECRLASIYSPLDIWITSRLHQLRNDLTKHMEEYNLPDALSGVPPFIDDLSNWFVRRSRRRFSKNDDEADKLSAFATLRYVLIYLSRLLAPFVPFLAEELYQKMTGSDDSVHLLDWPEPGPIDLEVIATMSRTRQIITDALALRMARSDTEEQIKIRQPLSTLTYPGEVLSDFYEQIIADEVNVKSVNNGDQLLLDKTLTPELREEGFARELVRAIQSARKHAGLAPGDAIKLSLSLDPPAKYLDYLKSEVLASEITKNGNFSHDEIAKINGENLTISLEKI